MHELLTEQPYRGRNRHWAIKPPTAKHLKGERFLEASNCYINSLNCRVRFHSSVPSRLTLSEVDAVDGLNRPPDCAISQGLLVTDL